MDFDTTLTNDTIGDVLYDFGKGGSLSGLFIAGDTYIFASHATLIAETDPSLTYSPSVAFLPDVPTPGVTPEPSSVALLGTGILGIAGVTRRRFNA